MRKIKLVELKENVELKTFTVCYDSNHTLEGIAGAFVYPL